MSTNQTHFEITNNQAKAISLLVYLLKDNGEKILNGTTKLSLTSSILHILNVGFSHITDDDFEKSFNVQLPAHFTSAVYQDLMCIYDFVQKTVGLKITHGITTLQNNVNITRFRSLRVLELKKIPVHMIIGLGGLRSRLTTLICNRCVNKLQDIFYACGSDRTVSVPWSKLTVVILSYNNIDELDQSLFLLPVVEVLDLSHNIINNTQFLECLGQLKWLNLSYNHLGILPTLHMDASVKLKNLNLRNNNLEELDGLELLPNLEELDLGYNCLIQHSPQLKPLRFLNRLNKLWLDGNPLSYHNKHRINTLEQLSRQVLSCEFQLDNLFLTSKEIMQAKRNEPLPCIPEHYTSSCNVNSLSHESGINSQKSDFTESNSLCESNEASTCAGRRKKFHKKREVEISTDDDDEMGREDTKYQSKQTNGNTRHLQTKEKVEKFRKELGNSWMVASTRLSTSDNCPQYSGEAPFPKFMPIENEENLSQKKQFEDTHEQPDDKLDNFSENNSSQLCHAGSEDDSDVVTTKSETKKINGGSSDISNVTDKNLSCENNNNNVPNVWCNNSSIDLMNNIEDDEVIDEQSFIVEIHCQTKTATLIISVNDSNLRERDTFTGRTLECLDIKSLLSVERLTDIKHGICLTFDYIRKDRKERIYSFTDDDSCQHFTNLVQPFLEMKVLEDMMQGAFKCLECNSQFSKDEANRKVQKSSQRLDGEPLKETGDYLREVKICPNCHSGMIIETDEVPLPNQPKKPTNEKNEKRDMKLKFPVQVTKKEEDTCEVAESESESITHRNVTVIQQSSKSLPSSPTTSHRQNLIYMRRQTEREIRNQLFSSYNNRNHKKCKSLDTSPLSSSPGSGKFSDQVTNNSRRQEREESVVKIVEDFADDSTPQFDDFGENSMSIYNKTFFGLTTVDSSSQESRRISESAISGKLGDNSYNKERRFSTPVSTHQMSRSESDITIRTNPSQSSISVLSTPNGDQNEFSFYTPTNETKDQEYNFKTPSPHLSTASLHKSLDVFSSSSGSNSVSTALEKSIYDNDIVPLDPHSTSSISHFNDDASAESIFESIGTVVSSDSVAYQSVEESFSEENVAIAAQSKSEPNITHHDPIETMSRSEGYIANKPNLLEIKPPSDDVVQSNVVKYYYDNYSQIDHRIRLYLDMILFDVHENFELILKANVISSKLSGFTALLIISNKNVYVLKITGEESVETHKWLQKIDVKPLTQLKPVRTHLGCQGFYLEFNVSNCVSYLFLLRDADRCEKFLNQLENVHESVTVLKESADSLQTSLKTVLIHQCDAVEIDEEVNLLLYILGNQVSVVKDKEILDEITLVVTSQCIHVLSENYQLHLKGGNAFQSLRHYKISDLTGISFYESNGHIKLSFFDEDSNQEFELNVALETERSTLSLIEALQNPWEQLFAVDLPITKYKI